MSTTEPEIDLRSCPFCGGAARANCDAPLMYLECVSCGARGEGVGMAAWGARAQGEAAMSIDRGIVERWARQSVASTVALSLPGPCIDADVRHLMARYRWRQMRIAVRSCDTLTFVRDRLTARGRMEQDHGRSGRVGLWLYARLPIAGPMGRLP